MKGGTVRVLQALTLFCVAALGFFLNAIVILVFYKRPALRSSSNRFVLSLIVANFLSVLGLVPEVLYFFSKNSFDCLSRFGSCIPFLVVAGSIFSTLVIAIDRYNAVLSPLHYSMTITYQRNKETIAVVWCLSGLLSAPPLLGIFNNEISYPENEIFRFFYVGTFSSFGFAVPLFALFWVYARMYIAAHKNSERTRRQSMQTNNADHSRGGSIEIQYPPVIAALDFTRAAKPPMLSQIHKRRGSNASFSAALFREEGRAVKTAVMVVVSFVLCWGPFFIVLLLSSIKVLRTLSHNVVFIEIFPIALNTLLSPYIYVFRNEMARNEAVRLLFWWKKIGLYEGNVLHQANKELQLKKSSTRIRIRHQSSSNYDSMSVQSFQLPLSYNAECQQCSEPCHTPMADFVATYEVAGNPQNSNEPKSAPVTKTRGESVTFKLAFLPQKRCQACVRQNSDSSSGSAHPLLKDSDSPTLVLPEVRHDMPSEVRSADDVQGSKEKMVDSPKQSSLGYDKDLTLIESKEFPRANSLVKIQQKKTKAVEKCFWSNLWMENKKRNDFGENSEAALDIKAKPNSQSSQSGSNRGLSGVNPAKRHRYKLQRLSAVENEDKSSSKFPPGDFG